MLESMLLTFWLMSASMPEGCAVMGTVFHSTEQTFALLHSDCLIEIQRHDRWIIMTSPRWVVAEEIPPTFGKRSEEHTSELQSRLHLVCRLLLEKKKKDDTRSAYDRQQMQPPRPARSD